MSWPSIDHSLISPSGRMSKAARKRAHARENRRLFEGCDFKVEGTKIKESESLRRHAKRLRELAARGMRVRLYPKQATIAEARATELEAKGE